MRVRYSTDAARVAAEHLDRAGVGVDQPDQDLQRGRLAGAVRAEQAGDALADLEARAVERPHRPEGLRHPGDADERHRLSVCQGTRRARSRRARPSFGPCYATSRTADSPSSARSRRMRSAIGGCVMNSDEMPPRGSGLTAYSEAVGRVQVHRQRLRAALERLERVRERLRAARAAARRSRRRGTRAGARRRAGAAWPRSARR